MKRYKVCVISALVLSVLITLFLGGCAPVRHCVSRLYTFLSAKQAFIRGAGYGWRVSETGLSDCVEAEWGRRTSGVSFLPLGTSRAGPLAQATAQWPGRAEGVFASMGTFSSVQGASLS